MKSLSHCVLLLVCSSFTALLGCASEIQEIEPPEASGPPTRAGNDGGRSSGVEGGSGGVPVSAPSGAAGTSPEGAGGSVQSQGGGGGLAGSSGQGGGGASGAGGTLAAAGAAGSAGGAGEEQSPCVTRSFEYEAEGAALESVHVSGSFNEWSEPGTALSYDAASDRWSVEIGLSAGKHQYKFVLDGTQWITDPENPDTSADGYGGVNSVVVVTCP